MIRIVKMPRKISNAVHRYFNYDISAKSSSCKECGNKLKGNHASNLLNHLRLKHEVKYQEVLTINKNIVVVKESPNKNRKDEEMEKKRVKLLDCCIKLVAIHGRPFSLLEDKAFKEMKALISADFVEEANYKKIRMLIKAKAYAIRKKIASEVVQKLISVKMDSATCMDRQFVGINIQYIINSKIVVRNLAVKEIFFKQTAENLKTMLLEVLADFRIDLQQIYSLTTDNGANYLKVSKLLNEEIDNEIVTEISDIEDENEIEYHNSNFEAGLESLNALLLHENVAVVQENTFEVRQIACAAHTLQLCIKDVLRNNYEVVIEKCRSVVRILRRPLMKIKIRSANLKKPIHDCTTRWSSTYYMLERLIELKTFCDTCEEICEILNENMWIEIDNILKTLKPSQEATLRLQTEQLTVGDFYSIWIICKTKTENINLPLAQDLLASMTRREKNLLDNKTFLMGIFFDPRLKLILSQDERETAKRWISQVHQQMLAVESHGREIGQDEEQTVVLLNSSPGCSHDSTLSNVSVSFQHDLQSLEDILSFTQRVRASHGSIELDLDFYIADYLNAPRLAVFENTIEYWSSKLHRLAKIALVALAAPTTQVTVERLFSVLKFILTPSRNRLLDETLKNIILIKSNEDLFED